MKAKHTAFQETLKFLLQNLTRNYRNVEMARDIVDELVAAVVKSRNNLTRAEASVQNDLDGIEAAIRNVQEVLSL